MSNLKINDYIDVDSIDGTELILVSKSGTYRKTTIEEIRNLALDIKNTDLANLVGKVASAQDVKNILNNIDTILDNNSNSITEINSQLSNMKYDSISEMKSTNAKIGDKLKTYGYYNANDGGGANYIVVASGTGTDDSGSYITLNSGLQAKLMCGNGVDCKLFGCHKSNITEQESILVFKNWTNYVNATDNKFFNPSEDWYTLYAPLYVRKSFIGIGKPTFQYVSSAVGKVISATEVTPETGASFNVAGVMGINPKSASDTTDRFTIKGFNIYCTNGDDNVTPAQDYGIYFPNGNGFLMEDIIVFRPNKAGFYFNTNWMAELSRLTSWGSRYDGFNFGNTLVGGTFTSLTVKNCYAHSFKNIGWFISGAMYSTFMDLGADNGLNAECSYSIGSCWGTNFQNLGSEGCTEKNLISIGDLCGNISGVFALGNEFSEKVINIYSDSQTTIDGLYIKNCTAKTSTTPYSFWLQTLGTGANMNVIINNNTDSIALGSYIATPHFYNTIQGKVKFNTINNPYMVLNNVVQKEVITPNVVYLGIQTTELTPLQIRTMTGCAYGKSCLYWYSEGIVVHLGMFLYSNHDYVSEIKFDVNSANGILLRMCTSTDGTYSAFKSVSAT